MDKVIILNDKSDRAKLVEDLRASGGRVSQDSGGRILVVQVPEASEVEVTKRLPRSSKLLALDTDLKKEAAALDESDALFVDALKLRMSPAFIAEKKSRKPGDTPEEKEMLGAPDFLDELSEKERL